MRLTTIDAIDLQASFAPEGEGHKIKRIVDKKGNPVLNQAIWEIGVTVYEALQNEDRPDALKNYRDGLEIAEMAAQEFIEPLIVELIERGQLELSGPTDGDLLTYWRDQVVEAKILNFLQIVEKQTGHISLLPGQLAGLFGQIIAALILLKIDDAAISEFLDGRGLIENVEDIHTLYRHLSPPSYINAIQRHALQSRAQAGASMSNAKYEQHRATVFQWLDRNYKPGYKHADMAAEIEKIVPREYDTILKDITAWKKRKR